MDKREKDVEEYLEKRKNKEELISLLKILIALAGIIVLIVTGILVFIYSLKNPQLTRTEIMIYSISKYWWADLWGIIGYLYLHNAN